VKWIISNGKGIGIDNKHLQARKIYIENVTGTKVSNWAYIPIKGQILRGFYYCITEDEVDGTFITAHIDEVFELCSLPIVYNSKLVVVNSCIWENMLDKKLLYMMMRFNSGIELWFSMQELSIDPDRTLRQSTTINNFGQFGFPTSLSERKLFMNRDKGLMESIRKSFVRVSPVILLGKYE
jgi:hypothetical protein